MLCFACSASSRPVAVDHGIEGYSATLRQFSSVAAKTEAAEAAREVAIHWLRPRQARLTPARTELTRRGQNGTIPSFERRRARGLTSAGPGNATAGPLQVLFCVLRLRPRQKRHDIYLCRVLTATIYEDAGVSPLSGPRTSFRLTLPEPRLAGAC